MENKRADELTNKIMEVQFYPDFEEAEFDRDSAGKFPIGELSALGVGFASMPENIRTMVMAGKGSTEGLFRVTFPEGVSGHLASFKDGSGFLSTIIGEDGGFAGQARLNPANGTTVSGSAVIPYNPSMLFMSISLMHIEKKLSSIDDNIKSILEFLSEDKRSEMTGNLNYMKELLRQYKFNYDNEGYLESTMIKVQDIKHDSLQKIEFYKKQIMKFSAKKKRIIDNKSIEKNIKNLQDEFKNYQLAEYLYAMSSFVDILLTKNFDETYLKNTEEHLREHSVRYKELYSECYETIGRISESSINSHFMSGVSELNKITGRVINKIPVVERGPVDEKLIELGEKIEQINESKKDDIISRFVSCRDDYVHNFVENIDTLNKLYNKPLDICFDNENIYYISKN